MTVGQILLYKSRIDPNIVLVKSPKSGWSQMFWSSPKCDWLILTSVPYNLILIIHGNLMFKKTMHMDLWNMFPSKPPFMEDFPASHAWIISILYILYIIYQNYGYHWISFNPWKISLMMLIPHVNPHVFLRHATAQQQNNGASPRHRLATSKPWWKAAAA